MALTEKARALLDGPNFAYLATVLPDGAPHVAPLWVGLEGDRILLGTVVGRVKERNVRRDPRVAISIADAANPYDKVDIRGRVVDRIEDKEEVRAFGRAMGEKYSFPWGGIPGVESGVGVIEATHVHDGM
jgi:PPOX class probable F420-dependent enzyme